ncbi:MAG: hypothetical protein H7Z41_16615 [Cytophagales bacterium]|nr:hypothetical protein [Armatimonadota bacterium]
METTPQDYGSVTPQEIVDLSRSDLEIFLLGVRRDFADVAAIRGGTAQWPGLVERG